MITVKIPPSVNVSTTFVNKNPRTIKARWSLETVQDLHYANDLCIGDILNNYLDDAVERSRLPISKMNFEDLCNDLDNEFNDQEISKSDVDSFIRDWLNDNIIEMDVHRVYGILKDVGHIKEIS